MKTKTIKDFFNYAIGDLFVKGFLFISLPLLSRVMNPIEYGKLSLINSAIMILYVFMSLNMQNAIMNRFMKDEGDFSGYLGSVIIGLLPFQILLMLLSPLYVGYLSPLLGINVSDLYWVLSICFLLSYIYIYTSYLQGARKSREFVKINVISKVCEILFIFTFALFLEHNQYLSKVYAQAIINVILSIYVVCQFRKIAVFKFNKAYFISAVLFSAPLIFHVLSNSLLSQADRLIINKLLGTFEAGIYSFAYNLGMCIIVIVMAWNSSWQPKLYALIKNGEIDKIKKTTAASTFFIFISSSVAILFSKELVMLFAGPEYYSGIKIIPIIIIGNALIHIYLTYVNFVFYEKKSILISIGTIAALIANIGLNYILIPIIGIDGAAWATVASYFLLALFHYSIARVFLGINVISIKLLFKFTIGLISIYYINIYIESMTTPISIISRLSVVITISYFFINRKMYLWLND